MRAGDLQVQLIPLYERDRRALTSLHKGRIIRDFHFFAQTTLVGPREKFAPKRLGGADQPEPLTVNGFGRMSTELLDLPHGICRSAHNRRGAISLRSGEHGLEHGTAGKRTRGIVHRDELNRRPYGAKREADRVLPRRTSNHSSQSAALELNIRDCAVEEIC